MVNLFTKAPGNSIGRKKSVFSTDVLQQLDIKVEKEASTLTSYLLLTFWYSYIILKHIFKRGDHTTRILFFGPAACGISFPDQGLTCTLGTENTREMPTLNKKVQLLLTGKAPFSFSMKSFLLPLIKYNLIPLKSSQIFLFPPLIINHTKNTKKGTSVVSQSGPFNDSIFSRPQIVFPLYHSRNRSLDRLFREGAYVLLVKSIRP